MVITSGCDGSRVVVDCGCDGSRAVVDCGGGQFDTRLQIWREEEEEGFY